MIAVRRAALFLGLALATLAACDSTRPPERPPPSDVRVALWKDPQSLSLIGKTDNYSDILARLITDSLVQYDSKLSLVPQIAESLEIEPGGRVLTFRLRSGVRWHDGRPVTADDVAFTVERVLDPRVEARSYAGDFADLEGVEVVDERTVRLRYRAASADVLHAWTLPLLPRHAAGREPDLLRSEFASHPVGCGPFRFVHWKPGVEIRLARNADYWAGPPAIDGLVFRVIPDDRTGLQALLRGELDLMALTPDIWREAQGSPEAARLQSLRYFSLRVMYVGWNEGSAIPFFQQPEVRRAMSLALDRERFIERVVGAELGIVAATTYHPGLPWADPSVKPWPFDPQEARRLLDEAGWRDRDGDGVRERNGARLEFGLLVAASRQEINERIAAWIQQSLAEVGARVSLQRLDFAAFQAKRIAGEYDAALSSLVLSPRPDQSDIYHSRFRQSGFNYVGLADPELDRLLDEGRSTFEESRRREIYSAIQRRLHTLEPLTCLFHFASPVLYDRRLQGVEASPLDLYRFTPGPRRWRWSEGPAGEP